MRLKNLEEILESTGIGKLSEQFISQNQLQSYLDMMISHIDNQTSSKMASLMEQVHQAIDQFNQESVKKLNEKVEKNEAKRDFILLNEQIKAIKYHLDSIMGGYKVYQNMKSDSKVERSEFDKMAKQKADKNEMGLLKVRVADIEKYLNEEEDDENDNSVTNSMSEDLSQMNKEIGKEEAKT